VSANAYAPPNPQDWLALYLRLIAFPVEPAYEHSRDWWRGLTGTDPQTSTEKRHRQEREDSGPYNGVELSLAVDLLRVQWTASALMEPSGLPVAGPQSIGPFLARREWFRDLMIGWLDQAKRPIKRLAFVGVLIQPAADHRVAYERLNQYLRHVDLDPDSFDFIYRINRPLPGVNGLYINRLSTWNSLVFTRYQLVMAGRTEVQQKAGEEIHTISVEFDVNTPAARQEQIAPELLGPLCRELANVALKIASEGDSRP
jgi:hypothetical protein